MRATSAKLKPLGVVRVIAAGSTVASQALPPPAPLYGTFVVKRDLAASYSFHLLRSLDWGSVDGRRRSTAMSQAAPARRQTAARSRQSEASLPVVATIAPQPCMGLSLSSVI